ncbi:MAG: cell division protein ZapA [Calditrichaeota bacterium]|nr:cell division protein ZapA [Calditrichota bacterium]
MNDENKILKVKIFGTEYPLKVNADVEYVKRVARYVDTKMAEVQEAKPSRPLHQIAILAALNICDELFQNEQSADFEERLKKLSDKLELGINKSMESDSDKIEFDDTIEE